MGDFESDPKQAAMVQKMEQMRLARGEAPFVPIEPPDELPPVKRGPLPRSHAATALGDWRLDARQLEKFAAETGRDISLAAAAVALKEINPQRDPNLPVAKLLAWLDKFEEDFASSIPSSTAARHDPLVEADAPGSSMRAAAPAPAADDEAGEDGGSPSKGEPEAEAEAEAEAQAAAEAAAAAEPEQSLWAGSSGGWNSPQKRTRNWMSQLEAEEQEAAAEAAKAAAPSGPLSETSSLMGSQRMPGPIRPASQAGSIFSVESMSDDSAHMAQRSADAASWVEYCQALLRTGHCHRAAIGGVDGELWGSSPNFKSLTSFEIVTLAKGFDDQEALKASGIILAGKTYEVVTIDSQEMAGRLTAGRRGGAAVARSKTAVVMATYNQNMVGGDCAEAVKKVADHMRAYGL